MPNWNAEDQYNELFQKFRMGIQSWCRSGKEPRVGSQDMKYYLDLQEKRLKDHDLSLDLRIQPEQDVQSIHQISSDMPVLGSKFSRFDQFLYVQYVTRTLTFSRNNKELLQKKDCPAMYQTILNPDSADPNLGKTTYVCPNCSAISTIETLQDTGCPYCGTRYLMKDLYPKVTNYYFIDNGFKSESGWKTKKKQMFLAAGCISLAQVMYTFLTDAEFGVIQAFGTLLLGFGLWTLILYMGYSLWLLIYTAVQAGKSIPLVSSTAGSKAKLTQKLKCFDPAFDYEYFEGKALALARILMLSQNPDEFVQYHGPKLADRFSDVVDIEYRGGIGVRSIRKNQNRIEVELNLFLTNTVDCGGRLSRKNETIQLNMYHNADFPVDTAFSIVKVQCPNCAGSFDAGKEKTCPYCGQPYDAGINDWVVTKITR